MLYAFAKKELLHHLASHHYLASSVLLVVLSGMATLVGTADYNLRLDTYETRLEEHRQELEKVRVYSYLQPLVQHPPEPLAILARGFEDRRSDEVRIHVFAVPTADSAGRRNPFSASFHNLDLTTIVQVVLGLQALLLAFDAFVGEREQGTLQLVLAHGVDRATLLAGKFLGAFTALSGPLAMGFFTSLAIIFSWGKVTVDAGDGWRIAGLFGAYTAYGAVMLLLGFLISIKSASASRALALAVLSWLALIFLLPQTTIAVVGEATREDASLENAVAALEQELEERLDASWASDPLRRRRGGDFAPVVQTGGNRAVLRRCGSGRYYESLGRFYREQTDLGMDYAQRIFARRQARMREERTARQLVSALTSLSPAYLLTRITTSLASSSIEELEAFLAACRRYRELFIEFIHAKAPFRTGRWFTDDPGGGRAWPTFLGLEPKDVDTANFQDLFNRFLAPEIQQQLQHELAEDDPARRLDLEGLPRFDFEGTDFAQASRRVLREILLLLGLGSLLAAAIWRGLRHYGTW